jgi:SAM-dependent methyltransferase
MPNHRLGGLAGLATAPDGTARRAQVVAALADAIRPAERPARVRVAVDAVTGEVAPGLADELARALAASGRPAGRATLDGSGCYLEDPLPTPAAPAGEPGTVLVVDGSFLQHPELAGAWDLVVYLREEAAAAVAELGLLPGQTAVDLGCGTGRALPHLRAAVGPGGTVLGLDLTPEMLATARRHGRAAAATLVLADARRLPLRDGGVDAVFAAGLLPHLPDPDAGMTGIARVTRPGGRLCLFHPSGRAALAARHGRRVRDDDPLAEPSLRAVLARTGWRLERYHDGPDRFLALAVRDP